MQQPDASVDWCNHSAVQEIKGPPKSPWRYARRAFVPEPEIKQKTNSKQQTNNKLKEYFVKLKGV